VPTALSKIAIDPHYRRDSQLSAMSIHADGIDVTPGDIAAQLVSTRDAANWPAECSAPDGWCQDGGQCTDSTVLFIDVPLDRLVTKISIATTASGHCGMGEINLYGACSATSQGPSLLSKVNALLV
jgi:hypothetical protein